MSQLTAIEWTDLSWNPVHGCSKVSPGCAHCYAETLSRRYKQTLKPWTPANAAENVMLKPHKLGEPLSNRKEWRGLGAAAAAAGKTDGKLVFVNSTSDLFHEEIPDSFIAAVWTTMARAERHTFQVLTKRPERMRDLVPQLAIRNGEWLSNVWLGVSIENRRYVDRADVLRETPAAVRFISAEPLLGPLVYDEGSHVGGYEDANPMFSPAGWSDRERFQGPPLDLTGIDWLIVGGESGPGHRPMREEWVRDLRDTCSATGPHFGSHSRRTAFFFKQWGGSSSKAGGRELDGGLWSEFPVVAA